MQALRVIRHDFKTPLTSLKMLGQIFQMSLEKGTLGAQPERTERNCKLLIEQVDKLVQLADNLYEISVAQSGRLNLERQLADLRPVFQNLISRFQSKISDIRLPDTPVWGEWDTAKLLHAFSVLMSDGEALHFSVEPDPKAGMVRVRIEGNYKHAADKVSPGSYLARVIIEKHGGKLTGQHEAVLPMVQRAGQ